MIGYEFLYERHFLPVYRACLARFKNPDFALEVTQEAFARALDNMPALRDMKKFQSWVTTIALHYGFQLARLRHRHKHLPPESLPQPGKDAYPPGDLPYSGLTLHPGDTRLEGINAVRRWALRLHESDQQLFLMKYYFAMNDPAISRETGRPAGTVKRRLSRLKKMLETLMEQH